MVNCVVLGLSSYLTCGSGMLMFSMFEHTQMNSFVFDQIAVNQSTAHFIQVGRENI